MVITHQSIQIKYKGHLLKGEYSYSAKDLGVRLETPYGFLSTGIHIPYAMPKIFTDDEAEKRSRDLLLELWDAYCVVMTHKEEIVAALPKIDERKALLEQEKSRVMLEKKMLKCALKEGTVSNVEYQKAYAPLKERFYNIEMQQQMLFENAIMSIIKGDCIHCGGLETLVRTMINQKKCLTPPK